jgi:glycerophosphoryl diester phosphodiesterase
MGARRWRGEYAAFTVPEHYGRVRVVDERFIGLAARVGKPVHVWTVNDLEQARRLRGIGVSGLITNFPARLRQFAN